MKRIAWCLACAAGLAAALPLAAGTYHWTGTVDGFWTNANNWAEGAVPGRYETPAGRVGAEGDTAVFGDALAGKAVTTIDFDGVYSVLQILTEGTHRYVYGTAEDQYVPIEPFGVFSAAETAATPTAAIPTRLRLSVELATTGWGGERMTVRNKAVDEFVLGKWGYNTRAANHGSGGEPGVLFEGSGPIRLAGTHVQGEAYGMMVSFATTGLVTIDVPTSVRQVNIPEVSGVSSPQRIAITANGSLGAYSSYNFLYVRRDAVVSGEGPFRFAVSNRGGVGYCCENDVTATLTFLCPVETVFLGDVQALADYRTRLFFNAGSGTIVFAGESRLQGVVQATHYSSPTFVADALGMRGTYGRLGDVDFLFSNATLRYTGTGETTDRTVTLTNRSDGVAGRVALEQAGTGAFTLAGAVALADGMTAGTLVLKGASSAAPATFAGTLDAGIALAKEGTGFWTFAPQGDFTGAVSVSGGTLAFDASLHLTSLTAASGTTRIRVEAGRTLTVDALSVADGKTLDFILLDGAAVQFPNETAGASLANVTLNGHPVRLDDAGTLQAVTDGDNVWKAPVSGNWDNAANWVGEVLPDPSRTTYLDAVGGDYTVVFGGEEAREATVTNLVVNNVGAGTATLRVTNATLTVAGHTTQDPVLRVGAGGRLDVVDSVFRLWDQGNARGNYSDRSSVDLDGGELAVRGASTFITRGIDESGRTDGTDNNLNTRFTFGTGTLTFTDDAVFRTERESGRTVFFHVFKPTRVGETVDVVFRDRAWIDMTETGWEFALAGNGGRSTLLYDSAHEGVAKAFGSKNLIGRDTGLGEYLLRRGQVETSTYDFFHIGTAGTEPYTTWLSSSVTGRVEIAQGAALTVNGRYPLNDGCFYGVAVGNATMCAGARGTAFVHGELRVAGTFTQKQGNFLVAEGPNADGDVFQDGGAVSIVDDPGQESANTRGEAVIGAFGGHGRYTLTAGTFTTGHNVYLGGATTNDLFRWHKNGDVLQGYHDARGVLTVSGGSFTTAKNLILGRDGTGVLALTGAGRVAAASLVVSNTVGQAASEIRFTVDAERRCGVIDPATRVVFLPGARVVVDVASEAAQKTPRRVRVWSFETAPEGLEDVTFELVGAEGLRTPNGLALSDDGRTLAWNVSHGTVLLFR